MKDQIDNREFTCLVCMEHRWRTVKPRQGFICPYRAKHTYCPTLEHVYLREQDEELSWIQMGKDIEKNIELNKQRMAREAAGEKTIHQMKLYAALFNSVEAGVKTVEMRLDDAKRRWVREGDLIEYCCVDDSERKIMVEVKKKTIFLDFEELVENYDAKSLGFDGHSTEEICAYMRSLYDKQRLKACHVVAIEFAICEGNEGRRI